MTWNRHYFHWTMHFWVEHGFIKWLFLFPLTFPWYFVQSNFFLILVVVVASVLLVLIWFIHTFNVHCKAHQKKSILYYFITLTRLAKHIFVYKSWIGLNGKALWYYFSKDFTLSKIYIYKLVTILKTNCFGDFMLYDT